MPFPGRAVTALNRARGCVVIRSSVAEKFMRIEQTRSTHLIHRCKGGFWREERIKHGRDAVSPALVASAAALAENWSDLVPLYPLRTLPLCEEMNVHSHELTRKRTFQNEIEPQELLPLTPRTICHWCRPSTPG